jgi:hypothetical protein
MIKSIRKKRGFSMGYIDPGLFGIISQIGLALGLVIISAFAFLFKPFKKWFPKKEKPDNDSQQ